MNELPPDLQSIGKQALIDLLNNLTQAKGFVLEQAPEFCQQIIMRGIFLPVYTASVLFIAALIFFVFSLFVFFKIPKFTNSSTDRMMICLPLFFICFFLVCFSAMELKYALSVYIAPKVYLVGEITRMIK